MKNLIFKFRLLAAGILLANLPAYAQNGTLQGHVLDGRSGTPVTAGANVTIDGTLLGTVTDLQGFYTFPSVPPGAYTVRATNILMAVARYVVVTAGRTTVQDLISDPLYVTSTADIGPGTLRQAIFDANALGGTTYIFFDIPDSLLEPIRPGSELPFLIKPIVIDGTSQPGFAGSPLIEIDGTNAGATSSGFELQGSNCVIRALLINRFQKYGISANGDLARIEGNWIGIDATGLSAAGNLMAGIGLNGNGNFVGGTSASQRNIISGNLNGIDVHGGGNYVIGNYIGTDPSGDRGIPNSDVGVFLYAGGNVVGGLPDSGNVISACGFAGVYAYSGFNRIQGNFIGTNAAGTGALGNATGISVAYFTDNTLGGTGAARNVISGNTGNGIHIVDVHSLRTRVLGNFIGVDVTGGFAIPNGANGVFLDGNMGAEIGDGTAAGRNVISGNGGAGVMISTDSAQWNTVAGNFIGTDVTGAIAVGNGGGGVTIVNGLYNTIGGSAPGAGNVISANTGNGILITGPVCASNTITGNAIGTNASRTNPMGNSENGVRIDDTANVFSKFTLIGGYESTDANLIANNGANGVLVANGIGYGILSNQIYANHLLGIDLGAPGSPLAGVTPNDPLDADFGPNRLQNFPVIEQATAGTGVIHGSVSSAPYDPLTIQFFLNASADPSGYGQGAQFLGSAVVVTDVSGYAAFDVTLPVTFSPGNVLTATAMDTMYNSSEFSLDYTVPTLEQPVPSAGFVIEDYGMSFSSPGRLAVDPNDSVIVLERGKGQILRHVSPASWGWLTVVDHLGASDDVVVDWSTNTMYVSDLPRESVFAIDLTGPDSLHAENLPPAVPGLTGPGALAFVSVDPAHRWLYISLPSAAPGPKVVRANMALGLPVLEDVITYPAGYPSAPQRMAIASDGTLYLVIQGAGQIRALNTRTATFPVDGGNLPVVMSGLNNPHGIAIGGDGKIYVATGDRVVCGRPNSQTATVFVSGLSGGTTNDVAWTSGAVLYVSDAAAGRLLRVRAPRQQSLSGNSLTFVISQEGDPLITDGSDLTAIRNGFSHWQNVSTTNLRFIDGGLTAQKIAAAGDGINLVTFQDDEFPFPPYVLAVAAKTLVSNAAGDAAAIVDADILFNPEFSNGKTSSFGTDTKYGLYDIESIVTHESGHTVGLVHSGYTGATMFFVLQPGTAARTLKHDDQAWVSYLYPGASFSTAYGSIGGTVEDGYHPGSGVAGALVMALGTTTSDTVHAYTDQYGAYTVPGLSPGNYRVYIHPLDGDVFGYPLTAGYVSAYMQTLTHITDFPAESYNDAQESSNPATDIPSQWTAVPVSAGTKSSPIRVVTNLDNIPPTVTSVFPASGATGADVNGEVLVTFSEAIDTSTIVNLSTFSLRAQGSASGVAGSFLYMSGNTLAIFTPAAPLAYETLYTVQVMPGVRDLRGNSIAATFSSTFTTQSPDTTHPTVEQIVPANNADSVFITSPVTVVFSEAVQPATVTGGGMTLRQGAVSVNGAYTFDQGNKVVLFKPSASLSENTLYTVTLAATIRDLSGNTLAGAATSTFMTVPVAVPQVVDWGPAANETGVSVTTPVFVDFSKPVNISTVTPATFMLTGPSGQVAGSFDSVVTGSRIVFRPAADLEYTSTYTITVTGGIEDYAGRALSPPLSSSFATAAKPLAPEIFDIAPPGAVIGSSVTINGQGFDPDPSRNTVVFDTVTATVEGATLNSLTLNVPLGAASGPVTVTVGSVKSAQVQFMVLDLNANPSNQIVATVTTGSGTRNAAITPDGALAYVTNSATNTVSVIDLVTNTTAGKAIAVGTTPVKIAINPAGTYAWVTNYSSNTVSVIDIAKGSPALNTVVMTIPVGINPMGVFVTPDGSRVYVAELTSKSISVIDGDPNSGAFNRVVAKVNTSSGNRDAAVNPDGTLAFFTGTEGLTILDVGPASPTYNQVVAKVNPSTGTRNVAVTPDGTLALVTTMDGYIWIVDINAAGPAFGNVVAKVPTSSGSRDVKISPDGMLAYVTDFDGNAVLVYQFTRTIGAGSPDYNPVVSTTVTLAPVDTIAVGKNPEGLVFSPQANVLLVANTAASTVTVISLRGLQYDFVLLATNSIRVEELASVSSGNVIVNTAGTGAGLVSGADLSLGSLAKTGSTCTLKANRIRVLALATVGGSVQYNKLESKGTIKGTRSTPLPLPVYTSLPLFATGQPGTADVTVPSLKTTTLAPGNYRDLIVRARGKLILKGGVYNVRNISLDASSSLFFRAKSEVRVQGRVSTDGLSYIGPATDVPVASRIRASSIILYVAGINGTGGKVLDQPVAVGTGFSGTVQANLYAPNGTISIGAKGQATGAFAARDILIGAGAIVKYDSYFAAAGQSSLKPDVEEGAEVGVPLEFDLAQNFPNPFNPSTTIQFDVPMSATAGVRVKLVVYNILGQVVRELVNDDMKPGRYAFVWEGRNAAGVCVSTGVYLCRMEAGKFVRTMKMLMVR